MLLTVTVIKMLTEIALLALLGRWLLGVLAGTRREGNPFYQLLGVVTRPAERLTRWISPKQILDRHIPLATGVLLVSTWLTSTLVKIQTCLQMGVALCR